MTNKRNYTKGERALIYLAIAAGDSLEEVNKALAVEQQRTGMSPREVPQSSYDMVKKQYLNKATIKDIWKQVMHPKSIGEFNNGKK